jgi:hypothetical protein
VTDLDSETDRIWAERHRIVEDARELATQLVALAESAGERFPAATEENPAAEPGKPESLDRWEREDLDHWTDPDEQGEEHGEEQGTLAEEDPEHGDDVEATRAMPPVVPDEGEEQPPRSPGGQTEETRKLE